MTQKKRGELKRNSEPLLDSIPWKSLLQMSGISWHELHFLFRVDPVILFGSAGNSVHSHNAVRWFSTFRITLWTKCRALTSANV